MATKTTNYKLVKPALSDTPDITAINPNWDTLDTKMKSVETAISNLQSSIGDISATPQTNYAIGDTE